MKIVVLEGIMQREIKFRGKRLDNGEWVYGNYFIDERDIEDGFIWRDIPQIQQRYGDHYQYYDVDPSTVGQYTGLKDKNGKEIYEGDILRLKCWDRKTTDPERETLPFTEPRYKYQNSVIEYWQSCTNIGYRLRNGKGKTIMVKPSALSSMEAEVIGNIYENETEVFK